MNLTLKGLPEDLYLQLKRYAEVHRRSLNGEVIARLEAAVLPHRTPVAEHLERARMLRSALKHQDFQEHDQEEFKRQGRA